MTRQEAIEYLHLLESNVLLGEKITEAVHMAIEALQQDVPDTNAGDTISRQAAIDALNAYENVVDTASQVFTIRGCKKAITNLPSAQPEYEPVKAEDFAKTMSENTLYGFMAWHSEALELMERQGFVICKKKAAE